MSDDILNLIRNMQTLNAEIARLILSFDKICFQKGFINYHGNFEGVIRDCSGVLSKPNLWAPPYMYRSMKNRTKHSELLHLNIVLDNPEAPQEVNEALALVCQISYKNQPKKIDDWTPWNIWFSGLLPENTLTKTYLLPDIRISATSSNLSGWDQETIKSIISMKLVAWKLSDITHINALENLISRVL